MADFAFQILRSTCLTQQFTPNLKDSKRLEVIRIRFTNYLKKMKYVSTFIINKHTFNPWKFVTNFHLGLGSLRVNKKRRKVWWTVGMRMTRTQLTLIFFSYKQYFKKPQKTGRIFAKKTLKQNLKTIYVHQDNARLRLCSVTNQAVWKLGDSGNSLSVQIQCTLTSICSVELKAIWRRAGKAAN